MGIDLAAELNRGLRNGPRIDCGCDKPPDAESFEPAIDSKE